MCSSTYFFLRMTISNKRAHLKNWSPKWFTFKVPMFLHITELMNCKLWNCSISCTCSVFSFFFSWKESTGAISMNPFQEALTLHFLARAGWSYSCSILWIPERPPVTKTNHSNHASEFLGSVTWASLNVAFCSSAGETVSGFAFEVSPGMGVSDLLFDKLFSNVEVVPWMAGLTEWDQKMGSGGNFCAKIPKVVLCSLQHLRPCLKEKCSFCR